MRGRLLVAVGIGIGVLLVGGCTSSGLSSTSESISSYDVTARIGTDGTVTVDESIAYDFGSNQRHGIIRYIPLPPSGSIDHVTVTRDGAAEHETADSADGGEITIKVGDPNRTISGTHRYDIRYVVHQAVYAESAGDAFDWNMVGTQWDVPIRAATATVIAPAPISAVRCYVGPDGSRDTCPREQTDGSTATFGGGALGTGSGLTVYVTLPTGSVHGAVAGKASVPVYEGGMYLITKDVLPFLFGHGTAAEAFTLSAVMVIGGIVLALLGLAYVLVPWGRRRPRPGAPEDQPPDDVTPLEAAVLVRGRLIPSDFPAAVVGLASSGHLRIEEVVADGMHRSELMRQDGAEPPHEVDKDLLERLFGEDDRVPVTRATRAVDLMKAAWWELQRDYRTGAWFTDEAEYRRRLDKGGRKWRRVGRWWRGTRRKRLVWLVIVAIVAMLELAWRVQGGVLGAGLVAGALVVCIGKWRKPVLSVEGRALRDRVLGYRQRLVDARARGIDVETFAANVAYLMVFGLATDAGDLIVPAGFGESAPSWLVPTRAAAPKRVPARRASDDEPALEGTVAYRAGVFLGSFYRDALDAAEYGGRISKPFPFMTYQAGGGYGAGSDSGGSTYSSSYYGGFGGGGDGGGGGGSW